MTNTLSQALVDVERRIYLASRFSRRHECHALGRELQARGATITSRWTKPDSDHVAPVGSSEQAADSERERFAREDVEDLRAANWTISLMEAPRGGGRGGRHVEFGYALAFGHRLTIIGPRETVFHHLPNVEQFDTVEQFLESLPARFSSTPSLQTGGEGAVKRIARALCVSCGDDPDREGPWGEWWADSTYARDARAVLAALAPLVQTGGEGAFPQQIGRVSLGERRSDGERLCSHSHEVPAGHPLYWPERMGEYPDDMDPLCLEHAIEQAVSDNGWCEKCAPGIAPPTGKLLLSDEAFEEVVPLLLYWMDFESEQDARACWEECITAVMKAGLAPLGEGREPIGHAERLAYEERILALEMDIERLKKGEQPIYAGLTARELMGTYHPGDEA